MERGLINLGLLFNIGGKKYMKLILKDGQELTITRANDTYSYDSLKDGLGCDLNRNTISSIVIFNPDKSLETIKDMLAGDNRTGFRIIYGNTQKDYNGMKIDSISEEISNERSIISISLIADKTIPIEESKKESEPGNNETTKNETETKEV